MTKTIVITVIICDKLKRDVGMIKEAPKLIIEADKTTNYYQLSEDEYQELITPSIHKDYKKAADSSLNQRSEFFSKCWHKKRHLLV